MGAISELGGNKPSRARSKVRSSETTITIMKGAPVCLAMTGTNDGLLATSIENLANAMHGFVCGIAMQDIAPGKIRETLIAGVCEYARVLTASRATTTDAWASFGAGALGDVLNLVSAAGAQGFSRAGSGSANVFSSFVLGQTYASGTTQASSVGTGIWLANTMKVFIRLI